MVAELKEVISKVEQLDDEEQKQFTKLLEDEIHGTPRSKKRRSN